MTDDKILKRVLLRRALAQSIADDSPHAIERAEQVAVVEELTEIIEIITAGSEPTVTINGVEFDESEVESARRVQATLDANDIHRGLYHVLYDMVNDGVIASRLMTTIPVTVEIVRDVMRQREQVRG